MNESHPLVVLPPINWNGVILSVRKKVRFLKRGVARFGQLNQSNFIMLHFTKRGVVKFFAFFWRKKNVAELTNVRKCRSNQI